MSRSNKDTPVKEELKTFTHYSKVVGITFSKPHGDLLSGGFVKLKPEPTNKVDKDALMVMSLKGEKIGYIAKEDSNRDDLHKLSANAGYKVAVAEHTVYVDEQKKLYKDIVPGAITHVELTYELTKPNDFIQAGASTAEGRVITTINGSNIIFNEQEHKYYNVETKEELTGVSSFYHKWVKEFDPSIVNYTAKAYSINASELSSLWDMKRTTSSLYGNWVHMVMEMLYRYHAMATVYADNLQEKYDNESNPTKKDKLHGKIITNSITPINYPKDSMSKALIESYIKRFDPFNSGDMYQPEAVVRFGNLCGTIDLLEMIDNDSFKIVDYKTNSHSFDDAVEVIGALKDIFDDNELEYTTKSLYLVQLNLYREMVERSTGAECLGLELRTVQLDNSMIWDDHQIEMIDMLDRLYVDSQHQRVLQ